MGGRLRLLICRCETLKKALEKALEEKSEAHGLPIFSYPRPDPHPDFESEEYFATPSDIYVASPGAKPAVPCAF
jgi:hypothetical protein